MSTEEMAEVSLYMKAMQERVADLKARINALEERINKEARNGV